ncbi:MAG: hypothetical protein ACREUY_05650 [Burkholderiales bacterium]
MVPGIFGSKLRNRATGKEVWPGSTLDIVFSNYQELALEINPRTLLPKPLLLGRDSLNPAVPRHDYSFFPLALSFSLCETHERLTGNINFQDNLLNVLLTHSRDT